MKQNRSNSFPSLPVETLDEFKKQFVQEEFVNTHKNIVETVNKHFQLEFINKQHAILLCQYEKLQKRNRSLERTLSKFQYERSARQREQKIKVELALSDTMRTYEEEKRRIANEHEKKLSKIRCENRNQYHQITSLINEKERLQYKLASKDNSSEGNIKSLIEENGMLKDENNYLRNSLLELKKVEERLQECKKQGEQERLLYQMEKNNSILKHEKKINSQFEDLLFEIIGKMESQLQYIKLNPELYNSVKKLNDETTMRNQFDDIYQYIKERMCYFKKIIFLQTQVLVNDDKRIQALVKEKQKFDLQCKKGQEFLQKVDTSKLRSEDLDEIPDFLPVVQNFKETIKSIFIENERQKIQIQEKWAYKFIQMNDKTLQLNSIVEEKVKVIHKLEKQILDQEYNLQKWKQQKLKEERTFFNDIEYYRAECCRQDELLKKITFDHEDEVKQQTKRIKAQIDVLIIEKKDIDQERKQLKLKIVELKNQNHELKGLNKDLTEKWKSVFEGMCEYDTIQKNSKVKAFHKNISNRQSEVFEVPSFVEDSKLISPCFVEKGNKEESLQSLKQSLKRSVILQESSDKEKASGEFSHLEDDISEEVEESEENEESAENRESEEEFFSFDSNFGLM